MLCRLQKNTRTPRTCRLFHRNTCHSRKHTTSNTTSCRTRNTTRTSTRTSTLAIDAKIINEFAKKNAPLARRALQVPPIPSCYEYDHGNINTGTSKSSTLKSMTISDYLRFRNWKAEYIDHDITNALISHAMTFPLTLAYHADHFIPHHHTLLSGEEEEESRSSTSSSLHVPKNSIRLCCVGSRAEANLPDEYWREFLIGSNLFHNKYSHRGDGDGGIHNNCDSTIPIHWVLDFVGPEISPQTKSRQITLPQPENPKTGSFHHTSLTMNYRSSYLHNHILNLYKTNQHDTDNDTNTKEILKMYHGFILFNPGCGHPHLEKAWKPSLEYILKTNRNFLMTAHSQLDSERDRAVLSDLILNNNNGSAERSDGDGGDDGVSGVDFDHMQDGSNDDLRYTCNPFASRMSFEDPFPTCSTYTDAEDAHVVRPNYSVVLHGLT